MTRAPTVSLPALLAAALLLTSCAGTERKADASALASAPTERAETQTDETGQDALGETCEPACEDARADKLFVDSVKLLMKANDKNVDLLQEALDKLKEIRDCLPCSEIAAALSAPRGFDDISIEELERKIRIKRKEIPRSCRRSPLHDSLKTAMGIETHYVRDDTITTIARKLVRGTGDFGCAQEIVELVGDDDKRKGLRQFIARARVRVPSNRGRCAPVGSRCGMSADRID